VQSGLDRLLKLFPAADFSASIIDEYNRQCAYEFERVRDFIILHYHANDRTDSAFWIDRREMAVPDTLTAKMALFRDSGRIVEDADDLFKEVAWLQVMLGQHIYPQAWHPAVDQLTTEQLDGFLSGMRRFIAARAEALPDHRAYLERYCPALEGT